MEEFAKNPLGVVVALVGIMELFNLVSKVADNIKAWRKPGLTVDARLDCHDRMLDNDNKRIDSLTDGQVALIKGVKALIWHERTGNSVDKLTEASDAIDQYLTTRR
ncbi:MAG: hypothetical protein GXY67_10500 [Clostridiales bacterium]|nr:hypothetical protein [Clostridiales bacterium]